MTVAVACVPARVRIAFELTLERSVKSIPHGQALRHDALVSGRWGGRPAYSALRDYSEALDRHLVILREKHEQLTSYWGPTRDLYQGAGAEVFAEAMERANARFNHMTDSGGHIQSALRSRISDLEQFDSPTRPEL
jgi:hypothetical protein